jgi:hypothetical protein
VDRSQDLMTASHAKTEVTVQLREYAPPKLTRFGTFSAFTQHGGDPGDDGGGLLTAS